MAGEPAEAPVVIKLGGSLLTLPRLGERLTRWLQPWSGRRWLLVAGGGAVVDQVREFDRLQGLDGETAHWLAVRALGLTARFVQSILAGSMVVDDGPGCREAWARGSLPIFEPYPMIWSHRGRPDELPRSWDVTSDSIAAWLAARAGASDLVLLKSISAPAGLTVASAARAGLVDPYFPEAARSIPRVILVGCRTEPPSVRPLG